MAFPLTGNSQAPGYERHAANVLRAAPGQALAEARAGSPVQAVASVLSAHGRDADTLAALRMTDTHSGRAGATHVRFEQRVDALPVYGAYAKAAFNRDGALVHVIDQLAPVTARALPAAPTDALQALQAAMAQLHPEVTVTFSRRGESGNSVSFDGGTFFHSPPSVSAVVVPHDDGTMARGWLVQTWTQRSNQLHHTLVSGDGRVLLVESRTANDSYNVFTEDPGKGVQTPVAGPGTGNTESPSGWLGASAQSTINISGNNVSSYLDTDANNLPDAGGSAVADGNFFTAADLNSDPAISANRAVAVQNLFYLNNVVHDILYRHGFNEAAGNFQVNNFSKGGQGNDPVQSEAQDGSGTDNANFATPGDGSSPRMQMYLWTGGGPTHEVSVSSPVSASFGAKGAAFGPALTTTGLSGQVVASTPADGCSKIGSAVSGKVALIDRGTCEFTVKVLNAQSAGATAVIVANNVATNILTMGGSNRRIRIPSVMIGASDGQTLHSLATPSATLRRKATPPLQIDGDLDADIVFHEYGHGLTWRMIGGMSGPLAGAIGEGASDVNAFLINGDDTIGEYAFSNPAGIRRSPYSGYPLTYGSVTGTEVHDDGKIYAGAMWRLLELYLNAGLSADDLHDDFVDGMNFTPTTPAFEDMRDGMLESVAATTAPARRCLVWSAFAQSGIGVGASGTIVKHSKVSITESFAMPVDCSP